MSDGGRPGWSPADRDPKGTAGLTARALNAEEARRRLSAEVADLMHRLQTEEGRSAALEQQVELLAAERMRAVEGAKAERRRLVELEQQLAEARAALAAQPAPAANDSGAAAEAAAGSEIAPGLETVAQMDALSELVDTLRASREDAERRASRLENEITALRLNARIVEDELRAARARRVDEPAREAQSDEAERLRDEHARLRAEIEELRAEHARLSDDHADTSARLEAETRRVREVEVARLEADRLAAETTRDLGVAMGDLMEAMERGDRLEVELAELRSRHEELAAAHERLRAGAAAERETAEANLAEQRRVHDGLRADAAAAHERRLREAAEAHERAMHALQGQLVAAEARAEELTAQLEALTVTRDQLKVEAEKAASETTVVRQRLREEIAARSATEETRTLLEDELGYLRTEVFGGKTPRRGLLGRRGRSSPAPSRGDSRAPAAPAAEAEAPKTPAAPAAQGDIDAVLARRLFSD